MVTRLATIADPKAQGHDLTDNPTSPMNAKRSIVRIGLVQHPCTADPKENLDKAIEMIRQAAQQGAQIVATQELFSHRYFPQVEHTDQFELAEAIPGPTSEQLCRLAHELGIEITASIFEKRTQGIYHNTSLMISPNQGGQIVGTYRKMHIPDDPGFYEKFYFTPGDAPTVTQNTATDHGEPAHCKHDRGWQVQDTRLAKTGMLVCWDQWFPEAARLTALRGAQILFYPTAIGYACDEPAQERTRQKDAWLTIQRSHAIANGVFVVAINRVGVEDNLTFWGSSFVVDPGGTVIAQADEHQAQTIVVDCDLSLIDTYRQAWPFLRDRRVDAYYGLTERFPDHD